MVDPLIITAPHAYCYSQSRRTCDLVAESAARRIYSESPFHTVLFLNKDTPRAVLDLNRDVALNSPFRRSVRNYFRGKRPVLLDIHSFPNGHFGTYDLVILKMSNFFPDTPSGKLSSQLERLIFQSTARAGTQTNILHGSDENSIVYEALSEGVTAVLLEFNESIPEHRLNSVISGIINALMSLKTQYLEAETKGP